MNTSTCPDSALKSGTGHVFCSDFPSRGLTPKEERNSSSEDGDAELQPPTRSSFTSNAVASIRRSRVSTTSNLPFEDQVALREVCTSIPKTDIHSNNSDELPSAGDSPLPKNAVSGLRSMMARMFGGSSSRAASKSNSVAGSSAVAAADDVDPWVVIDPDGSMSREEIMERAAKTRAELTYDAPFAHFSETLLRKRYRSLNTDICSLDWLSGHVDLQFEDKAQRMKVRSLFSMACCLFLCHCFLAVLHSESRPHHPRTP